MLSRRSLTRVRRSAPRGQGPLARLFAGLWMLLFVAVVAGAPVADGFVEHGEPMVVHIEDANGGHCPASHGADVCELCQLAQGLRAVLAQADVEIPETDDIVGTAPGARGVAPVELQFLDGRSSRAPPLG